MKVRVGTWFVALFTTMFVAILATPNPAMAEGATAKAGTVGTANWKITDGKACVDAPEVDPCPKETCPKCRTKACKDCGPCEAGLATKTADLQRCTSDLGDCRRAKGDVERDRNTAQGELRTCEGQKNECGRLLIEANRLKAEALKAQEESERKNAKLAKDLDALKEELKVHGFGLLVSGTFVFAGIKEEFRDDVYPGRVRIGPIIEIWPDGPVHFPVSLAFGILDAPGPSSTGYELSFRGGVAGNPVWLIDLEVNAGLIVQWSKFKDEDEEEDLTFALEIQGLVGLRSLFGRWKMGVFAQTDYLYLNSYTLGLVFKAVNMW